MLERVKHQCYFNLSMPFCNQIDFKHLAKRNIQFNLVHCLILQKNKFIYLKCIALTKKTNKLFYEKNDFNASIY